MNSDSSGSLRLSVHMISQEQVFWNSEADAWLRRNPDATTPATNDDPVMRALNRLQLPSSGSLLDVGGAAGRVAAAFVQNHAQWTARVIDASAEAIAVGQRAFPHIEFERGTITRPLPTGNRLSYDVVVISGVLCWVERSLLSSAIACTDAVLKDGGLLVLADYDPPFPRANAYAHHPGLYTYKQDYPACYLALGTYQLIDRQSFAYDSAANPADPYDRQWLTAVLRKDLVGRYVR